MSSQINLVLSLDDQKPLEKQAFSWKSCDKLRQLLQLITNYDSFFITNYDKLLANCDRYFKLRQNYYKLRQSTQLFNWADRLFPSGWHYWCCSSCHHRFAPAARGDFAQKAKSRGGGTLVAYAYMKESIYGWNMQLACQNKSRFAWTGAAWNRRVMMTFLLFAPASTKWLGWRKKENPEGTA